jgi:hypothetical protein
MEFKEPFKIYTAASNLEAHMIVAMLDAKGIEAFADEDVSGVSIWGAGTISQFHQPNVWIEKSNAEKAAELILRFEEDNRNRATPDLSGREVQVECEACGKVSHFPSSLNGTTQDCSHCGAYVDVDELDWDEDVKSTQPQELTGISHAATIYAKCDGEQRESPLPLLRHFSLQDIFLLHAIIALTVLMESVVFNAPIGILVYPAAVALWSVARLHTFRRISYVNPFTLTCVTTWIIFGVYEVVCRVHEPWRHHVASNAQPLDVIVTLMLSGLGIAFILVLISLFIVAGWRLWSSAGKHVGGS